MNYVTVFQQVVYVVGFNLNERYVGSYTIWVRGGNRWKSIRTIRELDKQLRNNSQLEFFSTNARRFNAFPPVIKCFFEIA